MPVKIESYCFGRMTVNGREYTADLIIYPNGTIQGSWWRREGHRLMGVDILELLEARPEVIVAGTGASGLMRPDPGLTAELAGQGIELIVQPTAQAMHAFNRLCQQNKKIGGCFHLTC